MDTFTHIVLGACIGEAIAGKKLGKKALFIGAIAQSLPDIDFVASFWLPVSDGLLAHRGFTHSFLFAVLLTPVAAWASAKIFPKSEMTAGNWTFFWGLQLFVHLFIDAFNAYGTGWFEPFSHYRVSFNTMYVADPLFTIWPAAASVALLLLNKHSRKRKAWMKAALILSSVYLVLGVIFKLAINDKVKNEIEGKQVVSGRHFITPTPLNNLLWYIVAENDSGYDIGYRSVFDKKEHIDFHFAPRNDTLLMPARETPDVNNLIRFSDGYYSVEQWHDTLVFNDLRFGEILGWADPNPKFVFYYFLQYPDANKLIVQRGRFAGWDKNTLTGFIRRIKGI